MKYLRILKFALALHRFLYNFNISHKKGPSKPSGRELEVQSKARHVFKMLKT